MEKYEIKLDRRVLKQLGSQLYGDTPSVIAELVANSYDADAHNVWITIDTEKNDVLIEDDGKGMTASDINKSFLNIGYDKRPENGKTASGRKIMGRKGIGKLATFSLTNYLRVLSVKDGIKAGCALDFKKITEKNEEPVAIPPDQIKFSAERLSQYGTGTRLELKGVKKKIAVSFRFIVNKLMRTFDVNDKDFSIHIRKNDGAFKTILRSDLDYFSIMDTIITIGDEFNGNLEKVLNNNIPNKYKKVITYDEFVQRQPDKNKIKLKAFPYTIDAENVDGNIVKVPFEICGWIGTVNDLPSLRKLAMPTECDDETDKITINDNRISLYSRGKLGEFDILSKIKNNRNSEAYVVGELYVDVFEQDGLSDMAISNRRGYEENDPRYTEVIKIAKRLLSFIVDQKDAVRKLEKEDKQAEESAAIKENFKSSQNRSGHVFNNMSETDRQDVEADFKQFTRAVTLDYQNKRPTHILISHRQNDVRIYGDFLIELLVSMNSQLKDIITFTSNPAYGIRKGRNIFEELKQCFRPDYLVIFLFTKSFYDSNSCLAEAGAAWATNTQYMNFPIDIDFSDIDKPIDNAKAGSRFIFDSEDQKYDFCLAVQSILATVDKEYPIEDILTKADLILSSERYVFTVPMYYPKRKFQLYPICDRCGKRMVITSHEDTSENIFKCTCGNMYNGEII